MSLTDTRPASSPALRRILDAATLVFGRYGFRRASMDAVASEAGLSRQGLYRHFATKEALFVAVGEEIHRGAEAAAADAAAAARQAGGSPAAVLTALIGERLAFFAEGVMSSPHAAELMEETHRLSGALVQEGARLFRETLVKAIEGERTRKRLTLKRGLKVGDLADLLVTATNGVKYAMPLSPAELRRTVGRLTELLVAGAAA